MNNVESRTDSDTSNEVFNINNNNKRKNIINNSIDSENRNYNIGDCENDSIVTNNIVNRSIDDNRANISNNECVNIYVT